MSREVHVPFYERLGVQFPRPTHRFSLSFRDVEDLLAERGINATGDPRPITQGHRFDCDRDVTEQADPPSEERCHNVATTGVDSRGLPETGGHVRMAGT